MRIPHWLNRFRKREEARALEERMERNRTDVMNIASTAAESIFSTRPQTTEETESGRATQSAHTQKSTPMEKTGDCMEETHPNLEQEIEKTIHAMAEITTYHNRKKKSENSRLRPRMIIGNHRIEEFIGEGGMGAVYRATDLDLNRPTAIKMVRAIQKITDKRLQEEAIKILQAEARAMAQVNHPNVAKIYTLKKDQGEVFASTEFIKGPTILQVLNGERESAKTWDSTYILENILPQLCGGYGAIHEKGLLHLDGKPANTMIEQSNDEEVVKIIDFGLSKIVGSHAIVGGGTYSYMPLEQLLQVMTYDITYTVDKRSDLFMLGATLYEIITRERFQKQAYGLYMSRMVEEVREKMRRREFAKMQGRETANIDKEERVLLEKTVAKFESAMEERREYLRTFDTNQLPGEWNPEETALLKEITLRLIATKPEDRYQDVGQVIDRLQEYQRKVKRRENARLLKRGAARMAFPIAIIGSLVYVYGVHNPTLIREAKRLNRRAGLITTEFPASAGPTYENSLHQLAHLWNIGGISLQPEEEEAERFKAHYGLGNARYEAGRNKDAVVEFKAALALTPPSTTEREQKILKARLHAAKNEIEEAHSELRRLWEEEPSIDVTQQLLRLHRQRIHSATADKRPELEKEMESILDSTLDNLEKKIAEKRIPNTALVMEKARLQTRRGLFYQERGTAYYDQASAALDDALLTAQRSGDKLLGGMVLINYGVLEYQEGDHTKANALLLEAEDALHDWQKEEQKLLEKGERTQDIGSLALAYANLSGIQWEKGNTERAYEYAVCSINIYKKLGLDQGSGLAYYNKANIEMLHLGDIFLAESTARDGIDAMKQAHDTYNEATLHTTLGEIYYRQGEQELAFDELAQALTLFGEDRVLDENRVYALTWLGVTAVERDTTEQNIDADKFLLEAEGIATMKEDKYLLTLSLISRAREAYKHEEYTCARKLMKEAKSGLRKFADLQAMASLNEAELWHTLGFDEVALKESLDARVTAEKAEALFLSARAEVEIARNYASFALKDGSPETLTEARGFALDAAAEATTRGYTTLEREAQRVLHSLD